MIFVLIGLVLYTVLGGADFGAGLWQLIAGTGEGAARIREHAHHSMAAVWEANHLWLIFVLTVTWTAYPQAFGSIASTLAVPLFIAGMGIVFRGAAYALRSGASSPRELRVIDTVFSLSLSPRSSRRSRSEPPSVPSPHVGCRWAMPLATCSPAG
jgi:cytochrome d ubiquinol oxidase subunit II